MKGFSVLLNKEADKSFHIHNSLQSQKSRVLDCDNVNRIQWLLHQSCSKRLNHTRVSVVIAQYLLVPGTDSSVT